MSTLEKFQDALDSVYDSLTNATTVKTELGYFGMEIHDAIQGRNPRTGEQINIPEKKFLRFIPSAKFMASVSDDISLTEAQKIESDEILPKMKDDVMVEVNIDQEVIDFLVNTLRSKIEINFESKKTSGMLKVDDAQKMILFSAIGKNC